MTNLQREPQKIMRNKKKDIQAIRRKMISNRQGLKVFGDK
jgi:hypothetical protein